MTVLLEASRQFPANFGRFDKDRSSVVKVQLDFFNSNADFWEPGREFATNAFVRPPQPTGFSYEAITAGQSGAEAPAFSTTLGGTTTDGEVIWTTRDAGANAFTALTSPAVVVTSTASGAVTAGSATVVDGKATSSKIEFTLSAGVAGKSYEIRVTVTVGSYTLIGVFIVHVK